IYMTHIKVMGSILSSEGPTSPMMMHAPMNTFVAILAASFSSLYIQMLSLAVIIAGYHVAIKPVEIHDPFGAFMMILLGWFSGIGVGLVFLALKPWFPGFTQQLNSFYTRVNIFASGKMTVGNMLPYTLLPMFLWNPLFHIIDQARGYVFVNYFPHHTNYWYPLILSVVLILIGLMAESYTRKHASLSWFARR
ncbi:MAG: ABC transporter permease, partial [Pseudomonadota bacterium]